MTRQTCRGSVLIWYALLLPVLAGLVALALEYAHISLVGAQLQNAADAAALAGAQALTTNDDAARAAAAAIAGQNVASRQQVQLLPNPGNLADGDVVLGIFDPNSGSFTPCLCVPNAVKVTARRTAGSPGGPLQLIFGPAFGVDTSNISRTAIAMLDGGKGLILLLDPHDDAVLKSSGNGAVIVDGAVIVNSDHHRAAHFTGNGTLKASHLKIVGDLQKSGDIVIQARVQTGVSGLLDPYRSVAAPVIAEHPVRASGKTSLSSDQTIVLQPGVYMDGISISGDTRVIMEEGVYIMAGGGFQISGRGSLHAEKVVIYNTSNSGKSAPVQLSGLGKVVWTPPINGPYAGLSVFYDRAITNKNLQVSGNGQTYITGALYAAGADAELSGNGIGDVLGGAVVARRLNISGEGSFTVSGEGTGVRSTYLVK